jgi:hypothetical protein
MGVGLSFGLKLVQASAGDAQGNQWSTRSMREPRQGVPPKERASGVHVAASGYFNQEGTNSLLVLKET